MGFFQRFKNGFYRFMYGRNGADHLGLAMVWTVVAISIINMFLGRTLIGGILHLLSTVLMFIALFRMFSRNLPKRRAENAKYLQKIWWPLKNRFAKGKQQRQDKEHKYFTCPTCGTVCRVPRGKGKIVITCPKCHGKIEGKS